MLLFILPVLLIPHALYYVLHVFYDSRIARPLMAGSLKKPVFIDSWPVCMLCSERLHESLLHNGSAFIKERLTLGGNHKVKHYIQI